MQGALGLVVRGTDRRYPRGRGANRLTVGRSSECEILRRRSGGLTAALHAGGARWHAGRDRSRFGERHVRQRAAGPDLHGGGRGHDSRRLGDLRRRGAARHRCAAVGLSGGGRDLSSMLESGSDVTLEPVIRKRFEPARFDWLSTASSTSEPASLDFSLLQRAQRHLSIAAPRLGDAGVGARSASLADATLGTILDVTGGDRAAFVLRRARSRIPAAPRSPRRASASPGRCRSSSAARWCRT